MLDADTADVADLDEGAPEAPEQADPKGDVEEFNADRAKAKIAKVNAEAAALRKRLKDAEPMLAKAKELEDASKTEAQRLTEDRDVHKTRAEKAEAGQRRFQVALDRAPEGATLAMVKAVAKRVTGESDDDLEADADELFKLLAPASATPAKTTPPAGKPRESLRGGGDPDESPEETDPRKLAAQITR